MSFWAYIIGEDTERHREISETRAELHKAAKEQTEAAKKLSDAQQEGDKLTTSLAVAAQALAAVVRGRNGEGR